MRRGRRIGIALLATMCTLSRATGVADSAAVPAMPDSTIDSSATSNHAARDSSSLRFALRPVATLLAPANEGSRPQPTGLAVDAFGRVFVSDAGLHGFLRMDATGRTLGQAGSLGSGAGAFRRPSSLALLGAIRVAVLDTENRRVVAYDLFDRLQGTLIEFESLEDPPARIDPVAMASDRGGAVYVSDRDRDRVVVFDFSGRFVRVLGGFGQGPGSFRGPSGLAVNRLGELIVCEQVGRRIQRLDPAGQPRAWWPLPTGGASGALSVATDDSLRVAVADEARGVVWIFDGSGRLLAEQRDLDRPSALAFAPDGSLLIGERGAGRLRRFVLAATDAKE
jgi:DNA-binding beta-propeller fold protein YncE